MAAGSGHDGSIVSAAVVAGLDVSTGSRAARFRRGRLRGPGLWGFNSDFMGVQLGSEVILDRFARPTAARRDGSGNLLENVV
jgi:hypothetical protein